MSSFRPSMALTNARERPHGQDGPPGRPMGGLHVGSGRRPRHFTDRPPLAGGDGLSSPDRLPEQRTRPGMPR